MNKSALSPVYNALDWVLAWSARIGAVAMVALIAITMYDVMTRYFSIPKFAGLNSTMVQESEYWAHGILFALLMGYGLTKQVHVRIDLVREMMPRKVKYVMEMLGILIFLIPFAYIGTVYCYSYAIKSFVDGEVSPSTIGLTNIWLLKSTLVIMFGLLLVAGVSQFLKAIDGLLGNLTEQQEDHVLGGSH
jgi:TRAP-type mannitol/chloroaromatic compound transport system permease small subunit